jgi:hypothetical protein
MIKFGIQCGCYRKLEMQLKWKSENAALSLTGIASFPVIVY